MFLLVAEMVTYGIVIQRAGIAVAILIGITSLALGFFVFRRLGLKFLVLSQENFSSPEAVLKSMKKAGLTALGAFLLILPGFLTNSLGAILILLNPGAWLVPSRRPMKSDDSIVDLDPADWTSDTEGQRDIGSLADRKEDRDKFR